MGFLGLCDLVSKERHKATTRNGVSQGRIMFARDTSSSKSEGLLI